MRRCSDYLCIEIPIYRHIKKKGLTPNNPEWHKEVRARLADNNVFLDGLTQRVLGKPLEFFRTNYMFESKECIREYLVNWRGIYFVECEGYYLYLIPRGFYKLVEWARENRPVRSKLRQRFPLAYIMHTHIGFFFVEETKKFNKKSPTYIKNNLTFEYLRLDDLPELD